MLVRNVTRSVLLGDSVEIADSSAKRRTGLLSKTSLPPGQGLWIVPCEAIHTFGMKFAIDVVFLNKKRKVLKMAKGLDKRKIAISLLAHSALELPAGTLEATGTMPGDQLEFEE